MGIGGALQAADRKCIGGLVATVINWILTRIYFDYAACPILQDFELKQSQQLTNKLDKIHLNLVF